MRRMSDSTRTSKLLPRFRLSSHRRRPGFQGVRTLPSFSYREFCYLCLQRSSHVLDKAVYNLHLLCALHR